MAPLSQPAPARWRCEHDGVERATAGGGRLLELDAPLILPRALLELVEQETPHLEAAGYELGLLGWDMPRYYEDYEFARYLPEAWPFALDSWGVVHRDSSRQVVWLFYLVHPAELSVGATRH